MSFYPALHAPGCTGWITICNYPPNNWEHTRVTSRIVHATWSEGDAWRNEPIATLQAGESRTFKASDLPEPHGDGALVFLSLSSLAYPQRTDVLPKPDTAATALPAWRAALGLASAAASTSYQGEIDPFPPSGSLLTFCPFLQYGESIENYLLFVNLENSPSRRVVPLEVRDAGDMAAMRASFPVRSNDLSVVPLDGLGFEPDDLPAILCRGMSGIPLYFSRTVDGACLSMEHTHPPASQVIHGKRWEAQKLMKAAWFSKAGQT